MVNPGGPPENFADFRIWILLVALCLLVLLIAVLWSAVTYFIISTLKNLKDNDRALFRRLTSLADDFHEMRGEHFRNHPADRSSITRPPQPEPRCADD